MKELTDFDKQKMHMQMHGKANFKDVIRYREMLRKRRIFYAMDVIAVICALVGILLIRHKNYSVGFLSLAITVGIVGYFVLRRNKQNKHRR